MCEGTPHRCSISVNNLLHHRRNVPGNPLRSSCWSNLTFSLEFMHAVASNVHSAIQFKGIAFDQERAQIVLQLPCDGLDIQDEPVYWVLQDGRCECLSVRYLSEAPEDELVHATNETLEEAYNSVADVLGYHALGKASNEDVEALRNDPGTLGTRNWEHYAWTKPADETSSCWWVANASEVDKTQTAKLICRSLSCLRLELQASRCAASAKLRKE